MPPRPRWLLGAAGLLVLCVVLGVLSSASRSLSRRQQDTAAAGGPIVYEPLGLRGAQARRARAIGSVINRTLVLYVFHESSEHYAQNLRFFTKVAIEEHSASIVDYLLVVNGESRLLGELMALARRRPNVRVLPRANACYDGGSIGEVLRAHPELLAGAYGYYVLMNSSVRGPFLPRYYPRALPWTAALTGLLTDEVKLAGTTINCQGQVHVQSMVLATDNTGLEILLGAGALDCPANLQDAIQRYELASTAAILDAGYNIDCLMTRYRGLDWRAQRGLQCNGGKNPHADHMNDGLPIDPFEVLFVKAKAYPRVPAVTAFLERYTGYYMRDAEGDQNQQGRQQPPQLQQQQQTLTAGDLAALESNAFLAPAVQQALQRERAALWRKARRCGAVFDAAFYLAHNPDLVGMTDEQALAHFDEYGFIERRAYRFEVPGQQQQAAGGPGTGSGAWAWVGSGMSMGVSDAATAVVRRKEQQMDVGSGLGLGGAEDGGEAEEGGVDAGDCTFED